MLTWLLVVLLGAGPAGADARLKVTSDRPIVLIVNMMPHPLGDSGVVKVDIPHSREGRQNVRVRNLLGQDVWHGEVLVPHGKVVTARWRGRVFEVVDTQRLQRRLPSTAAHYSRDAGARNLDDLADDGGPAEDPHLAAIAASKSGSGEEPPEPEVGPASEEEPAPSAPAGGSGRLMLVNRNSSWANVYVDGELHEFRGSLDPLEVQLPTGPHEVVVKDYRDKEVWAEGTVLVYADLAVELQFSRASPPAAINREEAWTPKG